MPDIDALIRSYPANEALLCEVLVRDYYSYLYRIALSFLGDPLEADDIAQESLLRALQNLRKYEAGTNFKNWLAAIAVNLSRDALRRHAARQRMHQLLLATFHLASPALDTPEEIVEHEERDAMLWKIVNELNDIHRTPLILRYVHGLPVSSIANILGIKEGTVHSRLHYAIRKIEKYYQAGGILPLN